MHGQFDRGLWSLIVFLTFVSAGMFAAGALTMWVVMR